MRNLTCTKTKINLVPVSVLHNAKYSTEASQFNLTQRLHCTLGHYHICTWEHHSAGTPAVTPHMHFPQVPMTHLCIKRAHSTKVNTTYASLTLERKQTNLKTKLNYLSGMWIPIRSISCWNLSLLLQIVHLKKNMAALFAWCWK